MLSKKLFGRLYWRISKTYNRKGQRSCGRDTKPHVLKHSSEKEHVEVTQENFKIIGSNFKNNRIKRKITEALLIKQKHPSLNVQDQSTELKLFN